jgi:hypothetical protein
MHLGAACRIRKARPRSAAPVELEAGRIDQIDRIAQGPAQMPVGLAYHQREQFGEYPRRAMRIGVRQGRARHRTRPQVVPPGLMALQTGDDLAQARSTRQLAVEQRHELALGGQAANPRIGPVHRHQPVKLAPRQILQKPMKNAILMAHGIDPPSPVRIVGETSRTEWNQCHAPVQQNSTGQPWTRSGHPRLCHPLQQTERRRGRPGQARPKGDLALRRNRRVQSFPVNRTAVASAREVTK